MRRKLIKTSVIGALAALLLAVPGLASKGDGYGDGLPDRWEKRHDLSLKVKQGKRNQDADGLRNKGEFRHGTDPRDADSDDDGVEDGEDTDADADGECDGKPGHGKPGEMPPPPPEGEETPEE